MLIADDEPQVREALGELVRGDPSLELVGKVGDASRAVDLAGAIQPDVVIVDVRMPEGGGPRAAREIRAVCPSTRVVALSAHQDRTTVLDMLRAGARGFVVQGASSGQILETIHRAARGLPTLSDEITADVIDELSGHLEREQRRLEDTRVLTDRMWHVLNGRGLRTAYQPIVRLADRRVSGFEALARFAMPPVRGPDVWFAEAAEIGFTEELELAALRNALGGLDRIPEDAYLSVNLSPATAVAQGFVDLMANVPGERIVVEITEHAAVEDYDALTEALRPLRAFGVRLAIDDVGAGFASLRHILRLRPDLLKLDMSLTRDIDTDVIRRALSRALISFASEIGAGIVAEGIETGAELEALRGLGVTYGQGYHLGRPGSLSALRRRSRAGGRRAAAS